MTLDLLAIGIAALLGVLGWRSGALAQCFRVAAAVAAFVAAAPVAGLLKRTFSPELPVSGPLLEGLLLLVSGVVVFVAIAVFSWLFIRTLWAASDGLSVADRVGGLVLGLVKSAVVVYFLVSTVALMQGTIEEFDRENRLKIQESRLLAFVDRYNVLVPWRFGDLERLHRAIEVDRLRDKTGMEGPLRDHPNAADILESPEMQELTSRDDLVEAAIHDRYYETLADSSVRSHLNDDQFVARLRMVDWKRLLGDVRAASGGASVR